MSTRLSFLRLSFMLLAFVFTLIVNTTARKYTDKSLLYKRYP